jgi:hypothetical protein
MPRASVIIQVLEQHSCLPYFYLNSEPLATKNFLFRVNQIQNEPCAGEGKLGERATQLNFVPFL